MNLSIFFFVISYFLAYSVKIFPHLSGSSSVHFSISFKQSRNWRTGAFSSVISTTGLLIIYCLFLIAVFLTDAGAKLLFISCVNGTLGDC